MNTAKPASTPAPPPYSSVRSSVVLPSGMWSLSSSSVAWRCNSTVFTDLAIFYTIGKTSKVRLVYKYSKSKSLRSELPTENVCSTLLVVITFIYTININLIVFLVNLFLTSICSSISSSLFLILI